MCFASGHVLFPFTIPTDVSHDAVTRAESCSQKCKCKGQSIAPSPTHGIIIAIVFVVSSIIFFFREEKPVQ